MERVQGQRLNSFRYRYDGYLYHEDTHQRGVRYTCAARLHKDIYCKVVAIVKNNVVTIKNGQHKHGRPVLDVKEPGTRKLQRLAKKLILVPDQIIDRVFIRKEKFTSGAFDILRLYSVDCIDDLVVYNYNNYGPIVKKIILESFETKFVKGINCVSGLD
ncbi:hypothetical protein PV327_010003 [Microctonus hyperodae]|uniref:FLYWCH-type domain-containing protein n=1 Tax=Microctonus hyperodae TaxID=165561 RepID=A0AA39KGA5_MICHY|nr:hypothetical protein PV327_010003 [Microctonus hyperodae]